MEVLFQKDKPQILLVAEGTYPFVRGGVSSWIHELITGLDMFTFGVVFIGGKRDEYGEIKYELPQNLVYLATTYIFEEQNRLSPRTLEGDKKSFEFLRAMHLAFKERNYSIPEETQTPEFFTEKVTYEDFLYSKAAWEHIQEMYSRFSPDEPFIDYLWNVRNLHAGLWTVANVAKKVTDFGLVHSPSTGYAGFLASLLSKSRGKPFVLTEHGIYTRERKIDIMNSDWIKDKKHFLHKTIGDISHIKKVWVNFFLKIGKLTYDRANIVISLFDDAREIQIRYGADPSKCTVIPNGVNTRVYAQALERRSESVPKVVALIGRVVSIKDVKTFIKSMRILVDKLPQAEGWIVGPTDEDPEYYQECVDLVQVLGLEGKVRFLGFQKTVDILPKVGLVTLTSISEGMPLIVLEAFAAGVPCVTTDVGSCKQLIYGGLDREDIALGKAGEIVHVRDTQGLASAYAKLLTEESLWKSYQRAALERVRRYYSKETFLKHYQELYTKYLNGWHSF